jgi:hydroxypyruvate reductase
MRLDALSIFNDALKAVSPEASVRKHLKRIVSELSFGNQTVDLDCIRHLYVVGAGKASAAMAAAVEEIIPGRITGGLVNVKYGHTAPLSAVRLAEAGHPIPDTPGLQGSEEILSLVSGAGPEDLVLCLISGGGSALLPLPAPGLTLSHKQEATGALLACGATIHEINTVRKHLSAIKGGQLARAAFPARLVTLILSDVVGDDLDVIASGPTVPDPSTFGDCLAILEKYDLFDRVPAPVRRHLQRGFEGSASETPKPGDAFFNSGCNIVIGTNRDALEAARLSAARKGYRPLVLSAEIEGEAREVAQDHVAAAMDVMKEAGAATSPACILSGGETTVTLRGDGKGGRNQEFVLAAALDIDRMQDLVIFSAGTDGTDGPTDAAGAVADSETASRARKLGMDPVDYLRNNDAYHFFEKLDDLVMTGPTNTNVMDLRIMLIAQS